MILLTESESSRRAEEAPAQWWRLKLDVRRRLLVRSSRVSAETVLDAKASSTPGQQLRAKLAVYQGPLGLTAIVLAILFAVMRPR